ncbi:MAG: hypothetical protein AVDCRST_MAG59-1970 [uncultured Thermomicrobiales bacterium]|uniref:Uncharacterized protein n=1 Tax=uncultured Thermomicrobiales bacterium TaxID=1645740 RepID=A0A6J4UNF9_9BACT|nr:MAG: hypothetical protein AVDCRST_MAG59-1970 [uncultured Thermomicrobiales bacterium]
MGIIDHAEAFEDAIRQAAVVASPRKFLEYVLVPGHRSGKSHIFIETLGFRPRSADDALALAALYVEEAKLRIGQGQYRLGDRDEHGRRCTIVVTVRGIAIRSGWILLHDGILALTTPFSGFATGREDI